MSGEQAGFDGLGSYAKWWLRRWYYYHAEVRRVNLSKQDWYLMLERRGLVEFLGPRKAKLTALAIEHIEESN